MRCQECGYPKQPARTERCWRFDLNEPCRRVPKQETNGVPVRLRRQRRKQQL